MIRINLLPIRTTIRREKVQQQLLAFAGVLIVTIIGCTMWTLYNSNVASDKHTQIDQKKKELAQLDKIIGEVNEFTTKKKELEEKLQIIEQLKKGKTGPVRALDDLSTEIPNRVWVTKFEEKGGSVTLEGRALDHEDVSAFMKALQKSKYFSGIVLGYSKASRDAATGSTLYQFKVTCRVNYSA